MDNLLKLFRRKKKDIINTPNEDKFIRLLKKYKGDPELLEFLDILILNRVRSNATINNQELLNLSNTKLSGIMQIREYLTEEEEIPEEFQRMVNELKEF